MSWYYREDCWNLWEVKCESLAAPAPYLYPARSLAFIPILPQHSLINLYCLSSFVPSLIRKRQALYSSPGAESEGVHGPVGDSWNSSSLAQPNQVLLSLIFCTVSHSQETGIALLFRGGEWGCPWSRWESGNNSSLAQPNQVLLSLMFCAVSHSERDRYCTPFQGRRVKVSTVPLA